MWAQRLDLKGAAAGPGYNLVLRDMLLICSYVNAFQLGKKSLRFGGPKDIGVFLGAGLWRRGVLSCVVFQMTNGCGGFKAQIERAVGVCDI